jgi:ATP-dependent protease ClpP protease subunit
MNFKTFLLAIAATLLAFGLLAFVESQAHGATLDWSKVPAAKIVPVVGEVNQSLLSQAQKLNKLAGESTIYVLINSPGGSVLVGNVFIQAMEMAKARGSTIECAVTNLAASMGMHILAHCDKRYVLTGGILLFHEARVGVQGNLTARELLALARSMEAMVFYLEEYMVDKLGCDPTFYRVHNEGETMWSAEYFVQFFPKFKLKIVESIGVPIDFTVPLFDPIANRKKEDTTPTPKRGIVGSPITFPGPVTN